MKEVLYRIKHKKLNAFYNGVLNRYEIKYYGEAGKFALKEATPICPKYDKTSFLSWERKGTALKHIKTIVSIGARGLSKSSELELKNELELQKCSLGSVEIINWEAKR